MPAARLSPSMSGCSRPQRPPACSIPPRPTAIPSPHRTTTPAASACRSHSATASPPAMRYDAQTFRLTHLTSTRPASFAANAQIVQELAYFYDPVGNITRIRDSADTQNVVYLQQPARRALQPTTPTTPLYRLIRRNGSRASRPDRRRIERRRAGHQRRFLPHDAAPARRRQCDGGLYRELRL